MNKALVRDFLTGLVVLLALVALCFMLIRFGEIRLRYFQSRLEFSVEVENAGGLRQGSPVTLNGVRVGQIESTTVLAPPKRGAALSLSVDHGVSIPRSVVVSVDRSFVGESSLEFSVPDGLSPAELAQTIQNKDVLTQNDISSLTGRINNLADTVDSSLKRLTKTADNIDQLAATYIRVGERLEDALEPRTAEDLKNGKSPNIRSTLARLDSTLVAAEGWLNDPTLRSDVREVLAKAKSGLDDANQLVQKLSATTDDVKKTITDAGAKLDGTLTKADAAVADVSSALAKIDKAAAGVADLVAGINQGKGTAGQLATNPDLYNNLKDAAARLDRALADFQGLIEKLKKEGLRIGL